VSGAISPTPKRYIIDVKKLIGTGWANLMKQDVKQVRALDVV
jgi:hypothetical protein